MRKAGILAAAALVVATQPGCERGEEPFGAAAAGLRGHQGETACLRAYRDPDLGFSFDLPCDLDAKVAFENPFSPDHVIRRRLLVTGRGEFDIVIDAWRNPDRLPLDAWVERFGEWATYDGSIFSRGPVGTGAIDALWATAGGECAPLKKYVLLTARDLALRLMYVDGDGGATQPAFDRLLQTFNVEERP